MSDIDKNAVEWRLAVAHHRYERFKLLIVSLTLVVLVLMGGYLIGVGAENHRLGVENHQALVILRCAVSNEVAVDEHGTPRDDRGKREAYEACVKRGAPIEPWPPNRATLTP